MEPRGNYNIIIEKLDRFIRKYYKNQLIKGALYTTGMVILFYLSVAVLEYYAHFGTTVRTVLFYSFFLINAIIIGKLIVIPLTRLYKLGNTITHQQAADIIGRHFGSVDDKLTNTLQLQKLALSNEMLVLVDASIEQRIEELKPIPFNTAIDLRENKKYLKYALIPLLLIGGIIITAPDVITVSTARLVEHRTFFEKIAPFQFVIQNESLEAIQQEDFELKVSIKGDQVPESVFLEIGDHLHRLTKNSTVNFKYLFKNVQENQVFRFVGDGFYSEEFELTALPNPIILNFETAIIYPKYLGRKAEVFKNTGDIIIPEGTRVQWKFNTVNTEKFNILFLSGEEKKLIDLDIENEQSFTHSDRFFANSSYTIHTANRFLKNKDSITYWINVIPDANPSIEVEEHLDSMSSKRIYFTGLVKDDYGFDKLTFNYRVLKKLDEEGSQLQQLSINKKQTQSQFFHYWDIGEIDISAGEEIEYYFEIWDNDGVNGSKSTKSESKRYKAPTLNELTDKAGHNNEEIKKDIEESTKLARKLQKDLESIQKRVMDKKSLDWEEKKKIQDLLNTQKQLQKNVEQLQKEVSRNFSEQSEYRQVDENILRKQKQLEELFEKIMTDEMKELFNEMERLLDEVDKSKLQEMLEKMELDNKDIEKELDRSLEIFKQLALEQKLNDAIEKLDQLQKEQEGLSKESKDKNSNSEELKKKQEELNKKFDEVKSDLEEMKKMNEDLEFPNDLPETGEDEKSIDEEMSKSLEMLEKGKNSKASDSQKNASDKMQEMSEALKLAQSEMEATGNEEDLHALRELLENLVQLSFDQEKLMNEYKGTSTKSPKYVKLTQEQKKLKDDAKMVEDSLFALSKRVVEIEPFVNREISAINENMDNAIQLMADRKTPQASSKQQYVMTAINNLALLLSEVVDQMQQQMANQMKGNQQCEKPGCKKSNCQKPGHGKPSISSMKGLQQQLNRQIKGMKKGQKPGGINGKSGMSKELAKLAAQQEAIRNELQKINGQLNKDGTGSMGNLEKLAKMMEETETDLVNRRITQETIRRQQDIMTRLLKAERAEREREMDQQRKATEAKNENFGNPTEFLEYNKLKNREMEFLKTVPASLKPFYKNKVNEYFNNFNE